MKKLVEIRKARGLTQQDLADLSGIKRPRISVIEQDKACPTTKTIERLAAALGCEPRDLM